MRRGPKAGVSLIGSEARKVANRELKKPASSYRLSIRFRELDHVVLSANRRRRRTKWQPMSSREHHSAQGSPDLYGIEFQRFKNVGSGKFTFFPRKS